MHLYKHDIIGDLKDLKYVAKNVSSLIAVRLHSSQKDAVNVCQMTLIHVEQQAEDWPMHYMAKAALPSLMVLQIVWTLTPISPSEQVQ